MQVHLTSVHICGVVVEYGTSTGRTNEGVATTWLLDKVPPQRAWQKSQGKPVGPTLLYFGCRNKSKDYIYQEELEAWEEDGVLTLFTAFSRDQAEKRYVIVSGK